MDVTQALKDTENSLRDFIAAVLQKRLGNDWEQKCGVTDARLAIWKDRKLAEEKRQESGVVEERLIYYADFFDIKTILEKNWPHFSAALGEWKIMRVWLGELEALRDPDAHRRELLPHQKHLILGVAGVIRTRLIRYRSKQETSEDYFPRIESARDSLGNMWSPQSGGFLKYATLLRPGDVIEYVITASDPLGVELEYSMSAGGLDWTSWQKSNALTLTITDFHVGKNLGVQIRIRSPRQYHAASDFDDKVAFMYDVLPPKTHT